MTQDKIYMFLSTKGKYFDASQLVLIEKQLRDLNDNELDRLIMTKFKNPTIILIISLFFGGFGVDRFLIGDIGLGILKLITLGCLGIWTFIDWFLIMKKTREKNLKKFMEVLL